MISFQNVSKTFIAPNDQEITALQSIDFEIHARETLCLIGTSGCGKTTLLKLINRLYEPSSGQILLQGKNITSYPITQLRRQIGYVVQHAGLFPHMTVCENICLLAKLIGWDKKTRKEHANELLNLVNLPPDIFANRYPIELSGGQKQRVSVARALLLDPNIILMDEPFGALDPITRKQMHKEFDKIRTQVQKTIVIVTHDMQEAFRLGSRIALLNQGRLVQLDTKEGLQNNPCNDFVREFLRDH